MNNSRSAIPRNNQEGYVQTTEEDGMHLRPKEWRNASSIGTEITRSNSERGVADGDRIIVKNDVTFREEQSAK